jgi:hypothetical protein
VLHRTDREARLAHHPLALGLEGLLDAIAEQGQGDVI